MKHKHKLQEITVEMLGTYLQKNRVSHCSSDAHWDWLKPKGEVRLYFFFLNEQLEKIHSLVNMNRKLSWSSNSPLSSKRTFWHSTNHNHASWPGHFEQERGQSCGRHFWQAETPPGLVVLIR